MILHRNVIPRITIAFIFTYISFSVLGQKENNNWFFGSRAGITFNTNPPSAITNGQLNTDEGVASASGPNGELLFYTDGRTVWNSNHQIMSNGTGLRGHISSTQSALITSYPGFCGKYLIFTTDGIENGLSNGLQYSIVDMNLNNGLGGVEQKNIALFSPVVEKLVAIPNTANNSIWLIAHQWNSANFLIFNLSQDGIVLSRTQAIGNSHTGNLINAVGYMKASPDGGTLAIINRTILSVELFKFDVSIGLLSDNLSLGLQLDPLYGLEFSPDGSNLFVGTGNQIYQFKLDPYVQSNITNSVAAITTSQNTIRALQRGPNDQIYVAINNQNFLGVIKNPNLQGANVNYTEMGIGLSGLCKFGLPPIMIPMGGGAPPVFELGNDTTLCLGQTLTLDLSSISGDFIWQDGTTDAKLVVSTPGLYKVSVTNSCGEHSDSIKVDYHSPVSLELGDDMILCENETIVLDVSVPNGNYLWQDGNTSPFYTINAPGMYAVTVMNACQVLKDTIHISTFQSTDLLPPDTVLCPGIPYTLTITTPGDIEWSNGITAPTFTVTTSGKYFVEVSNRCGVLSDTIKVTYRDFNHLFIPNVITPNEDGLNDILMIDNRLLGASIKILNRWGGVIFESTNYQNDWYAEGIPNGNYYYYIIDQCGTTYKGWIHILN